MSNARVAVVAGAGPGNGTALAERFAAAGYRVALLAREQRHVDEIAARIDGSRGYACDVGDPASVASCFKSIETELGMRLFDRGAYFGWNGRIFFLTS